MGFDYSDGDSNVYDGDPSLYDDSEPSIIAEITNGLSSTSFREGRCKRAINISSSPFSFVSEDFTEELAALTIALWVKLDSVTARQPILAVSGERSDLHLEVDDGHVQWLYVEKFPRFVVTTEKLVSPDEWTHLVAQYDATRSSAKLYINGELVAEERGEGVLRIQWADKTVVGRHSVRGERFAIQGAVDEFYIYYCALPPLEVK